MLNSGSITPPIAEDGIVKWSDCCAGNMAEPQKEIEVEPWPSFITGISLELLWEAQPITGTMSISCVSPPVFLIAWEKGDDVFVPINFSVVSAEGICTATLDAEQISSILVRRRVVVNWGEPPCRAYFPINIANDCKPGLPAVLGQHPTEQDLLAYFHGRIDEEDLMSLLFERSRRLAVGQAVEIVPPGRELQNYVVREFLEGLYGMEDVLRNSAPSPRVFEQAMLGEFSPVRLANETQKAFAAHRRTATATAFQLVELLRLIENISLPNGAGEKKVAPAWFNKTRERSLENLLSIVRVAAGRADFCKACTVEPFLKLVDGVLTKNTALRFREAVEARKDTN